MAGEHRKTYGQKKKLSPLKKKNPVKTPRPCMKKVRTSQLITQTVNTLTK
jgi:hypothetical protein